MLIGGNLSKWETLERPGYLGKRRDDQYNGWYKQFGEGNWRLVWQIAERFWPIDGAIALYEDAYWYFLDQNRQVLTRLISEASEVYDDAMTNIGCGLNYFQQETKRTHLQDIAIRRVLVRLGLWFRGSDPIQIRDTRGEHPLSLTLSPGRVPFHRPDLICRPELEGWWQPGSIESFYQSNRWLQVRSG